MLESLAIVARQVGVLFALMAVGFIANRLKTLRQEAVKSIVDIELLVVTPCVLLQAFQRVSDCRPDLLREVMQLFITTTLEIDEGQQLDVEFESRDNVTEVEYLEMIRLKTSVLLACALKMGGLLAEASADDQAALYNLGEKVGLAFQLQDDLLDVYGDPKVFGKNIGGDITSNKKTYMLINAIGRANAAQRDELMHWVEAREFNRDEKVVAVTRLYDEIGIRELCEARINDYFEQGRQYLEQISVGEERKTVLRAYVAGMMNREF